MTFLIRICALSLALCLGLSVSFDAQAAKTLSRGNGAEPYSLDPHRAVMTAENNIIGDMIMGLYTEDANARPILGAAESVDTSADGLTWTFKIRSHTWSDGVPVTAEDFVFAFRRVLDPNTAAEYASVLYPIKHALKVSDPHRRYYEFLEYGDADGYRARLAEFRARLVAEPPPTGSDLQS